MQLVDFLPVLHDHAPDLQAVQQWRNTCYPLWAITIASRSMQPLQLAEQHVRRWLAMQS